jgi:hypothetical protein
LEITVKDGRGEDAKSYTTDYDFGENIKASVKLFGEDVVHSNFTAKAKIALQDMIRPMLKDGKPKKEIDAAVGAWVLGVAVSRKKSQKEKAMDAYLKLPEEERAALLAELKAAG